MSMLSARQLGRRAEPRRGDGNEEKQADEMKVIDGFTVGSGSPNEWRRFHQVRGRRLSDCVADLYIVEEQVEVRRFLKRWPELARALVSAHSEIQAHFASYRYVIVRIIRDFGGDGKLRKELDVSVVVDQSVESAREALRRFDKEYWLKQSRAVRELICIDIRFE